MRIAKAFLGVVAIGLMVYVWTDFLPFQVSWDMTKNFPFRHFKSKEVSDSGDENSNDFGLDRNSSLDTDPTADSKIQPILESKYLVNTPGCKLPITPIMPEYYKNNWDWKEGMVPDCRKRRTFMSFLKEDELVTLKHYDPDVCTMHEILRHNDSDDFEVINKGNVGEHIYDVSSMDMYMMDCNGSLNFEANIRTDKDTVKEKMNHWKEKEERPINVLMLGLDTTSRSHFYRSLPKTMKVLDQMGFVDFKGFHSVGTSTWPNFSALLMGQREEEVEDGCRPSWDDTADTCPLIWQQFEAQKYITLYLDDWLGSFQWAGGVGFSKQPTDYYLHSLYKHLEYIQDGSFETRYCTSTETLPSFTLRYTERFVRKFQKTPFFALTWITMPLHEEPLALPNMDERLSEFFQFIQSEPDIYENTLIIIMGDHGERWGYFSSGSIEGFIERVLPPLFIRVPETLMVTHPEINFQESLKINSEKLITGFDIFQTLQHTLALSGLSSSDEASPLTNFMNSTALKDRSSLFVPIHVNRDCSTVNIPPGICVCNSSNTGDSIENPFIISTLVTFVTDKLNSIVRESKYSAKCESWEYYSESFISADILEKSGDLQKILMKFALRPNGKFEAHIQFNSTIFIEDSEEFDLIGDIHRTNSYGTSSWCVGEETNEDKLMKNYCSCLEAKPSDEVENS